MTWKEIGRVFRLHFLVVELFFTFNFTIIGPIMASANLYEILDVESTSSIDEIKKSYKSLAKMYHPDKCSQSPELLRKNKTAYEMLINSERRTSYDLEIRSKFLNATPLTMLFLAKDLIRIEYKFKKPRPWKTQDCSHSLEKSSNLLKIIRRVECLNASSILLKSGSPKKKSRKSFKKQAFPFLQRNVHKAVISWDDYKNRLKKWAKEKKSEPRKGTRVL